jgi:cephalosporin hydroxylase
LAPGSGPRRDIAVAVAFLRAFWREPRFWTMTLPVLCTAGRTIESSPHRRDELMRRWRERKRRAVAPRPPEREPVLETLRVSGPARLLLRPRVREAFVRMFNRIYFMALRRTVLENRWLGVPTLKYPTDLWVYQELVSELRPDLIVETGSWRGGSALYLATVCDSVGCGQVVSIDVAPQLPLPEHPRITFLRMSSTDPAALERVRAEHSVDGHVMVVLDSDHARDHVLAELRLWSRLVTSGSYLIVEDTNLNGNPVAPAWGPGPAEALRAFLAESHDFVADPMRERHMLTANPGGFLRRR